MCELRRQMQFWKTWRKIRLFKALVLSAVPCVAETWSMTVLKMKQLEAMHDTWSSQESVESVLKEEES